MTKKLIVKEKFSKFWPIITLLSLIATFISFYFYWSVTDTLLEGYLRLLSFIFFSLGLLSLFKLKDGQIEITTTITEEVFEIQYKSKNRIIQTEEWATNEIASIKVDEMPNRSLYNDLVQGDRCLRFRRNDGSDWIYLNKIEGRVIPLSQNSADKLFHFLKSNTV